MAMVISSSSAATLAAIAVVDALLDTLTISVDAIPTSAIKSIQRVAGNITVGNTQDNNTITAVVLAKTSVVGLELYQNKTGALEADELPYMYLSTTTNVQGNTSVNVAGSSMSYICWLVEWN